MAQSTWAKAVLLVWALIDTSISLLLSNLPARPRLLYLTTPFSPYLQGHVEKNIYSCSAYLFYLSFFHLSVVKLPLSNELPIWQLCLMFLSTACSRAMGHYSFFGLLVISGRLAFFHPLIGCCFLLTSAGMLGSSYFLFALLFYSPRPHCSNSFRCSTLQQGLEGCCRLVSSEADAETV